MQSTRPAEAHLLCPLLPCVLLGTAIGSPTWARGQASGPSCTEDRLCPEQRPLPMKWRSG